MTLEGLANNISDLARMVADGFVAIDKRFDVLEERVETGFREVHKRIDLVVEVLEDHPTRIKKLEVAAQ